MSPEWNQQPSNKSLQPPHLPQYEMVGLQKDSKNYEEASRMVFTRSVGVLVGVLFFIFLVTLDSWDSLLKTPETFGQINTSAANRFEGKISMSRHSVTRKDELKGFIFNIKPRKSPAGVHFNFVVAEVSVSNRSSDKYNLSIYSIMLITDDGKYYSPDLHTRSYSGRLKNGTLDPGETRRGYLVYHIPVSSGLNHLEMRGGQDGPLAMVSL